ncbi:MAG: cupin domain-containing protein [Ferruginibacter sp.]
MNILTPASLIEFFNLQPHPEGGWFKETYRSNEEIQLGALPARFGGNRVFSTAIYYLLEQGNFSAFHRIKSDECWHFYAGGPLQIYTLDPTGVMSITTLGTAIEQGQVFQHTVPANCWFASRPAPGSAFCFAGCTVAPGFDFADFEMAEKQRLLSRFPEQQALIHELCRQP